MEGYSVSIRETSKQLSAKERIKVKDTTQAISLDDVTQQGDFILYPDAYVILDVHNEKAKEGNSKDYVKYIVIDKAGTAYSTGSESFFTSLKSIMEEMEAEAPDEEYSVTVYRRESKNYKGKTFITCGISD